MRLQPNCFTAVPARNVGFGWLPSVARDSIESKVIAVGASAGVDARTTVGLPPHGRRPVRGDPGLETGVTLLRGCEPKDHG
jgi:hypothetical protein